MKVTLRSKPISKGRQALYLDFYPPISHTETGKLTRRQFLELYVNNEIEYEEQSYCNEKGEPQKKLVPILGKNNQPKKAKLSSIDKEHNKRTIALAENIKAQRQLQIQDEDYGFLKKGNGNTDFLSYFKKLADHHKNKSTGDRNNWVSVYNYLYQFTNGSCLSKGITESLCIEFKEYLQSSLTFVETKKQLANNSAVGYFNIFKRVVKTAFREKLLPEDFAKYIPGIKKTETRREYLTYEELRLLATKDCDLPTLKKAALFSALTGLRYSDIEKLKWSEIQGDEKDGYLIHFTQKKTKGVETLPISKEAFNIVGPCGEADAKVFPKMLYSAWQNQKLQEWAYKAGIYRKITFHSFRHTFATLQLTLGTDIYTVSKMLGHRDLHTTQAYAKIIDKTKREAAERIRIGFQQS
jgi:integrase